jgi:hypothetical protein
MPETTKMKTLSKPINRIYKRCPVNLKRKEVVESPHPAKTTPTPVQVLPFGLQPQKGHTTEVSHSILMVLMSVKLIYLHLTSPLTPVIEGELFMTVNGFN